MKSPHLVTLSANLNRRKENYVRGEKKQQRPNVLNVKNRAGSGNRLGSNARSQGWANSKKARARACPGQKSQKLDKLFPWAKQVLPVIKLINLVNSLKFMKTLRAWGMVCVKPTSTNAQSPIPDLARSSEISNPIQL